MCGVAGYFGPREVAPEHIAAALGLMGRRGPDRAAQRSFVSPTGMHIHLLHTRLSILDLDARASQPFHRGGRWISFNGEIYNHPELRASLSARGHVFRTTSDTEVLLAALEEGGLDALDLCEGMWAFALYDEAEGSLTLSRDRFGEKPLYLLDADDGGLYFGSEVKFVFALAGCRQPVNRRQLLRYLVNGYRSLYKSGEGFFEGVFELSAGTALRVDPAGARQPLYRYWRPDLSPRSGPTAEDVAGVVRACLIESVRSRLRSDVPVAFTLSGGLDSNALAGVAARVLGAPVHGFFVESSDPRYDESAAARAAASRIGASLVGVRPRAPRGLDDLRTLVRQHDAPVYTISYFVQWLMYAAVAERGFRVVLGGVGADELFAGYYDHQLMYLYEVRGDDECFRDARRAFVERVQPVVRNGLLADPECFVRNSSFRGHLYPDAELVRAYLRVPFAEVFVEGDHIPGSLLRNRMLNELFAEVVPVILHDDDHNAMYHSIENRSPFLDRALAEVCFGIPTQSLIRDGLGKAILRDAVRDLLPDEILENPRKVGFNATLGDVFDLDDPEFRETMLADGPLFDLVEPALIERLLATGDSSETRGRLLFRLACARFFLEDHA